MSETKAEETPLFPKKTKKKSKGPARNGKKVGIIAGVIGGIVLIAAVVTLVLVLAIDNTIKTEWGKTYYAYLEDSAIENKGEDIGLKKDVSYWLSFLKFDAFENPVMILRDKTGENLNMYYIQDEKVNAIVNTPKTSGDEMTVEYLYDIQREKFDYFLRHKESDSVSEYVSMSEQLANNGSSNVRYTVDDTKKTSVKDFESGEVKEVSEYEQTFVKPDVASAKENEFVFTDDEEKLELNKKAFGENESSYKDINVLMTGEKRDATKELANAVFERLNEIEDIRSKQTVTADNFHDIIDEDLKYFVAAYLGPMDGWNTIYKYVEKPSKSCEKYKPLSEGWDEYSTCVVLQNAGSKAKMKEAMQEHLSDAVITNIDRKFIAGTLGDFSDHDGDVWWMVEGGIGGPGYDSLDPSKATFVSANQDTGSVTVRWKLYVMGFVSDNFLITLQQTDGDYKVISYTRTDR